VLQQLEDFHDGTVSVNDTFRPVSRYFDRIVHPAQLLTALPRAIHVLTDAALCGPVTLALPQDVQTMDFDYPEAFFSPTPIRFAALPPAEEDLAAAAATVRACKRPLVIAGGGALYAHASDALRAFAEAHGVPIAETQAGKGALPWDHPLQLGAIGVTGSPAANEAAQSADLVLAVGTRLQDFTTGSHSLFPQALIVSINVNALDALKWRALPLRADAGLGLASLSRAVEGWRSASDWQSKCRASAKRWQDDVLRLTGVRDVKLPYEGDVIGAVQRSAADSPASDIVVCAAGTLPGELHKLWRASAPGGYHVEYGYSCMGYEIAGGLGVKMARPDREVVVMVGDGSYLMLNAEIATSIMLGHKLVIVVLDNRGYGCINRLQQAVGSPPFNNLFDDCVQGTDGAPRVDFAMNARSLGAIAEHVTSIADLEAALLRARGAERTYVISIDTDPARTTAEGGHWWDVAVPAVSERAQVQAARKQYETDKRRQQP